MFNLRFNALLILTIGFLCLFHETIAAQQNRSFEDAAAPFAESLGKLKLDGGRFRLGTQKHKRTGIMLTIRVGFVKMSTR